jgi:hypothetical protein
VTFVHTVDAGSSGSIRGLFSRRTISTLAVSCRAADAA